MKLLWALVLALGCMHVHGAPMEQAGMEEGSCEDAFAKSAAGQALIKINQDRKDGYIFSLHRLSNVHMMKHGETGVVFYLTLDVVETNCSVLNKRDLKTCEARPSHDTPVYGQCKAAIYINKVHRVVRLYKYSCDITPVPAGRLWELCPDCPSLINMDNDEIKKTVSLSLEKFNIESGLGNRFSLLKVTRALSGMGMVTHYNAEYTIQETTCPRSTDAPTAEKCPLMDCEFAHKGFCKASLFYPPSSPPVDEGKITVECEIYEPEAAERQKKLHLLGGETDHSHTHTHGHTHDHDQAHIADQTHDHRHAADQTHDHDHAHAADQTHDHDHMHDHTKSHVEHDKTQKHADNNDHHHMHDHDGHRHAHAHSHDHGHKHDHVHAHHAKAHNHSGDSPHHHHDYKHADGEHTHHHDHELALDHDHKHAHLHEHEHHHHHHDHDHETTSHDHPQGTVRMLPAMNQSTTVPDVPAAEPEVGVTLPLKEDPQIPRQMEPTIQAFPTAPSSQCTAPAAGDKLVEKLFAEDPRFKPAA